MQEVHQLVNKSDIRKLYAPAGKMNERKENLRSKLKVNGRPNIFLINV